MPQVFQYMENFSYKKKEKKVMRASLIEGHDAH